MVIFPPLKAAAQFHPSGGFRLLASGFLVSSVASASVAYSFQELTAVGRHSLSADRITIVPWPFFPTALLYSGSHPSCPIKLHDCDTLS
jgi:hypothetical protein